MIIDLFQKLTRVISSCINFKFTVSDRATDKVIAYTRILIHLALVREFVRTVMFGGIAHHQFDKLPKRSLHLR